MLNKCKNCQLEIAQEVNFCASCGQKVIHERLTVKLLLHQLFLAITNLEQGLWLTLKELVIAPSKVIKEYIDGRTKVYMSPFRFVFLLASISILISLNTHVYEAQQASIADFFGGNPENNKKAVELMRPYLNLIYMLLIPFISLFSWRFFKKKGFNYAEHLVTNAYLFGLSAAIGSFMLLIIFIFPSLMGVSSVFSMVISVLCLVYGYKNIFKTSYIQAFFKSILTIILGYLAMMLLVFFLTIIGVLLYIGYEKLTNLI